MRRIAAFVAVVLSVAALAQPIGMDVETARAKRDKKLDPPTISNAKNEEGQTWALLAAFGFVIAAGVANIIPPKRTHQD